mmetsp:Transcript_43220/g.122262  ORF Transcript_43220/g.122262 Transcript_43220/m.122262 type:complete len:327 (+) Transcript_43220:246-1226(+)
MPLAHWDEALRTRRWHTLRDVRRVRRRRRLLRGGTAARARGPGAARGGDARGGTGRGPGSPAESCPASCSEHASCATEHGGGASPCRLPLPRSPRRHCPSPEEVVEEAAASAAAASALVRLDGGQGDRVEDDWRSKFFPRVLPPRRGVGHRRHSCLVGLVLALQNDCDEVAGSHPDGLQQAVQTHAPGGPDLVAEGCRHGHDVVPHPDVVAGLPGVPAGVDLGDVHHPLVALLEHQAQRLRQDRVPVLVRHDPLRPGLPVEEDVVLVTRPLGLRAGRGGLRGGGPRGGGPLALPLPPRGQHAAVGVKLAVQVPRHGEAGEHQARGH